MNSSTHVFCLESFQDACRGKNLDFVDSLWFVRINPLSAIASLIHDLM